VDPVALACILVAAILHAAWNVLLKGAGDPLRTATLGVAAATGILVPLVVAGWLAAGRPAIPSAAWALGIASGGVEVAYFVFLAAAYRRGDLSAVYPVARGTAPLVAVLLGVTLLGERLTTTGWAGVALILVGLLLVQRPWRYFGVQGSTQRAAAGFALLTGITIATYSALDRVGVQQVAPWLYAGILWPACTAGLAIVWLARRRPVSADDPGGGFGRAAAWGLLMLVAYGFVLAAYSLAPLVIVAPLRELSVVLTSVWAVVRLREAVDGRDAAARIGGAALVVVGAIALALGA
jgi:drug/metabolite transporter (DMT)-like permease